MPYAVDIKIGRMMIPDHKTSTAACSGGISAQSGHAPLFIRFSIQNLLYRCLSSH